MYTFACVYTCTCDVHACKCTVPMIKCTLLFDYYAVVMLKTTMLP